MRKSICMAKKNLKSVNKFGYLNFFSYLCNVKPLSIKMEMLTDNIMCMWVALADIHSVNVGSNPIVVSKPYQRESNVGSVIYSNG